MIDLTKQPGSARRSMPQHASVQIALVSIQHGHHDRFAGWGSRPPGKFVLGMGRWPQFGRKDVGIPRIPSITSQDGLEVKTAISPSIALAAATNASMNLRLAWDSALAAMSVNGGTFLDAANFPAHNVRPFYFRISSTSVLQIQADYSPPFFRFNTWTWTPSSSMMKCFLSLRHMDFPRCQVSYL